MTYEEAKEQVAKKHNLGKTLVIGHRPAYYEEAAMLFTKFHTEQAILKAATYAESYKAEQSILNAYPLTNIK